VVRSEPLEGVRLLTLTGVLDGAWAFHIP